MKRILKIVSLVIITWLSFSYNVNAATSYKIKFKQQYKFGGVYNSQYEAYTTSGNKFAGFAYCMAPGRASGSTASHPDSVYYVDRVVDPLSSEYELALTFAYSEIRETNKVTPSGKENGGVISALLRLISDYYGQLDTGGVAGNIAPYLVDRSKVEPKNKNLWDTSNKDVAYVFEEFKYIITTLKKMKNLSLKQKYEKLLKKDEIFQEDFDFKFVSKTPINGSKTHFELAFKFKTEGLSIANIDWDNLDLDCKFNYKCNLVSIDKENRLIKVNVSTKNASESDEKKAEKNKAKFGMYLHSSYKTNKRADGRLILVKSSVTYETLQKMIILDSNPKDYPIDIPVWLEIPDDPDDPDEPEKECVCNKNDKNEYDNKFLIKEKDADGKETKKTIEFNDPKAEEYDCPDASTCKYTCDQIDDGSGNITYYGKDGQKTDKINYDIECDDKEYQCEIVYDDSGKPTYIGKNGKPTDRATYRNECLHICEEPSAENGNNYYCSEIGEDKGGQVCSKEDYETECECPLLKETCDSNPEAPECEEYKEKCPSCDASVSMPDTCNDFDKESELVGSIHDINQKETPCNSDVNPVKKCVINGTDLSGESYEAITEIRNNEYCKVWCDESYEFSVPTARYSLSGGYFNLSTKISGTRNCYISGKGENKELDYEAFEEEIAELGKELYAAWSEYNSLKALSSTSEENLSSKISAASSRFNSLNQKIKKKVEDYNNCTKGWTNEMNFEPEIEYDYHEEEYMKIGTGKFSRKGEVETKIENVYCLGDTDDQYKCLSNEIKATDNGIPNNVYKDFSYLTCNESGCSNKSVKLSKAKWIQKTKKNTATYIPDQKFNTYHQYGTVKTGEICGSGGYNNCLWTRLPDEALPVELKTGKGAFPFILKFNNIGQSNSTGELGRLVNSQDNKSVLSEYNKLPEDKKCTYNENDNGPDKIKDLKQNVGYVCAYINNCPECDVKCEEDNCELTEQCDGDCPIECKNCIFDGENTRYKFRPVSINNLFPNSCEDTTDNCREKGYNWKTYKATETEKEIEEKGEQTYEVAEYSYKLSPAQMKEIRDYNREVGVYTNTTMPNGSNALQCDQIELNGIMYSVRCKSTFLDDTSGKYFTQVTRNDGFTLWQDSSYCLGGNCVLNRSEGIGPSWK